MIDRSIYPNLSAAPLSDQQQFRPNKTNEIKGYSVAEIKERELMSNRLSKYIISFDYFDKSLIVSSVTTGSISIASFTTVIGAPVRMASVSFSLAIIRNCYKQQEVRRKNTIKSLC